MISCVKRGSERSHEFTVPLGIKQGGINSPDFSSCYYDGLTGLVRDANIGCYIRDMCLSIILFADDLVLVAPTRSALQRLIDSCSDYCTKLGITFNSGKSKVMVFGKCKVDLESIQPILLNNSKVEVASRIKYLGTTIVSNPKFAFIAEADLVSFHRSANSVLNVIKKPDEIVQMQLLFTNCVPTLTYACAGKEFSAREMADCNTALNSAIRKVFSFQRWESIRHLREGCGYSSLHEIFAKAKNNFEKSHPNHENPVLSFLYRINSMDQ